MQIALMFLKLENNNTPLVQNSYLSWSQETT